MLLGLILMFMLVLLGLFAIVSNDILNSNPTGSVVGIAGPAESPNSADKQLFGGSITGSSSTEKDTTDSG